MTEIPAQATYEQQAVEGVGPVKAEGEGRGRKVEDGLEGSPEQVLHHRNPLSSVRPTVWMWILSSKLGG